LFQTATCVWQIDFFEEQLNESCSN
jgi:hypothetical protein